MLVRNTGKESRMRMRMSANFGISLAVLLLTSIQALAGTTARDIINCGFSWASVVDALASALGAVYGCAKALGYIIGLVAAGMPIWAAIVIGLLEFGISVYLAYRVWSVFQAYMAARRCRVSQ
jgi:hypothetical protein